jgi:hypothetical protein
MKNNNNKLKAFVRFDGSGRIVPSSLIVQRIKPQVGNWREINSKECCDPNCGVPVYENDYVIDDVTTVDGVTSITIANGPSMSIEFQLMSSTNVVLASITVAKSNVSVLAVPYTTWEETSDIRVRNICGVDFTSNWVFIGM